MKHEWRKEEKKYYLPGRKPELKEIPRFQFLTISGQGNPNSESFGEYIAQLYALSYGLKMNLKKMDNPPAEYRDYTVYPLEGVWDLTEEGRKTYDGVIDKDELLFILMIRQPDFIDEEFFRKILELTGKKKPHPLLDKVRFQSIEESPVVQMLHVGPYDDEPESFRQMEAFAAEQGMRRSSKTHREIYLSDFRKTEPARLKTVLRFSVIRE
ncbi:MAG: GyrI-like domain-containing protein [Spirochaetales bacterium]|nr:GyrI-like domain-containing protein [Spirochaetales bacterium]